MVITAVHDEENNVIGFSKVTHDLTEKKKADEQLRANAAQLENSNAALQKMNKELQSFAYISSHDLQEPLRKIQLFISQIQDNDYERLSENGRDRFSRIQHAAGRMKTLINDLLEYSRTGTSKENFEQSDLRRLAKEVQDELAEEIKSIDAALCIGEMCMAEVIPFQFRQLLHNLVGNALKFKRPEVKPVININAVSGPGNKFNVAGLAPDTHYCHITVSDNGIGFDPTYKERIFEVFQRLHGKQEFAGTGIGLAIVKKIVDNHDGIITAEGEPNAGATFHIFLKSKENNAQPVS